MNVADWMLDASLVLSLAAGGAGAGEKAGSALRQRPRLVSPRQGATIAQNDPASGCPAHPVMGFGYHFDLAWAPVAGASAYEVVVEWEKAPAPTFQAVVAQTRASFTRCHSYVIDVNLDGWSWRVRGLDREGRAGPWSAPRPLRFAPCRAPDGGPCGSRPPNDARAPAAEGPLDAPILVSPPHGATFSHRDPRTTQLAWAPVPGAVAYDVFVDCHGCCGGQRWCSEIEGLESTRHRVDSTTFTIDWSGAQPGRWRVRAVRPPQEGALSPWWMFVYEY